MLSLISFTKGKYGMHGDKHKFSSFMFTIAGCKESQFYSLPLGQDVSSM